MISQNEIDQALTAAEHPVMVESAARLEQSVKHWLGCKLIGIDTEFVRERTWRARLGLVQVSDGRTVWLVDPLKTGTVEPLAALLSKTSPVKVLHAPSEDLDVLLYTTGATPQPLFDTQTACALLGQPLQMGYHKTVEWLFDVSIDKGETRSNWCKRPLRPAQLHYAALDVCLLPMIQRELQNRLQKLGRLEWLYEECALLVEKASTPPDPDQSWKRINGNGKLDGVSLAVLQTLAAWRDRVAEDLDRARRFVLRDEVLLAMAQRQPDSLQALSGMDILSANTLHTHGETIVAAVRQTLDSGLVVTPPKPLKPAQRKLMAGMKKLVQQKSDELNVEPALLASRRELEGLILAPPGAALPNRLAGWRKKAITEALLALKEGQA